jgi:hypothetical protein
MKIIMLMLLAAIALFAADEKKSEAKAPPPPKLTSEQRMAFNGLAQQDARIAEIETAVARTKKDISTDRERLYTAVCAGSGIVVTECEIGQDGSITRKKAPEPVKLAAAGKGK